MVIGGFQKNSLIDFPGTIACVIFTQGCNFICPYCHNPDLVAGPREASGPIYDEKKILEFLIKRKGLLDGVVITGGEPTLQKDIVTFCSRVKRLGYKIKLDTNGTRPKVLQRLFDGGSLDYVAMDIKTSLDQYDSVWPGSIRPASIEKSIAQIMEYAPAYEFRTTCLRPFVSERIIEKIGTMINGAKQYFLQQCSQHVNVLDHTVLSKKELFFSEQQLERLRMVAAPFVETVAIR